MVPKQYQGTEVTEDIINKITATDKLIKNPIKTNNFTNPFTENKFRNLL